MAPKSRFQFGSYVCDGDTRSIEVNGFTVTATIHRDEGCDDAPDERDDGFWPSLDPVSAGYIGPKSPGTLRRHKARAQAALDAWKRDEWFYCGVALSVTREGVPLTGPYAAALWGIECNYPGADNSYLGTVAEELLDEAVGEAWARLDDLLSASHKLAA